MTYYENIEEMQRLRLWDQLVLKRMDSKEDYDRWAEFESVGSLGWLPWRRKSWKDFLQPSERVPERLSKKYIDELKAYSAR